MQKAPEAPLPFDKMEGPFASLDAACAGCREMKAVDKPAAPFLDVRVVVSGRPDRPGTRDEPHVHFLAVRLPSGWWRREVGTETAHDGSYVSVYENRVETADVLPGGGAEVLVETRNETRGNLPPEMDGRPVHFDRGTLHLCGVGRSGQPSCTWVETYRFAGSASGMWDGRVTFRRDGTIVSANKARSEPERRYVVRFP